MHYSKIFVCVLLVALGACGKGKPTEQNNGSATNNTENSTSNRKLAQGCDLRQELFDQAAVFEPLAKEMPENQSPTQVSLLQFAPRRLSQGRQGSCTSWAAAYAAMTINYARATGQNPDAVAFSPAFVYNQITQGDCEGTHIGKTLEKLTEEGNVPLQNFPYTDQSCNKLPNSQQKQQALQFKMKGFNRLTLKHDDYKIDLEAIKQNIAQGAPVVIGMAVGGSFYDLAGKDTWRPTKKDFDALRGGMGGHIVDDGSDSGFGGHAMCVIGYDDSREGGAFQIMNSWGNDWGQDGIFWMKYKDFEFFCNSFYGEAYGLFPLADQAKKTTTFKADIGLFQNKAKAYIPFDKKAGATFETADVMPKGVKFKIAVRNYSECYVYVIGQETDGTSYVLFPYTEKHSPYCGIVGTRLFPKDFSLQLDDVGEKDVMAVLFSPEELDYQAVNQAISSSSAGTYEEKIRSVLGEKMAKKVQYSAGNTISFSTTNETNKIVAVVFEMQKK